MSQKSKYRIMCNGLGEHFIEKWERTDSSIHNIYNWRMIYRPMQIDIVEARRIVHEQIEKDRKRLRMSRLQNQITCIEEIEDGEEE